MTINKRKVAIIGCGRVGSATAFSLLSQGICDIILMVDINEEKTYGEVFDLNNCIEYLDRNVKIMYGTYADCSDADIIVIAAGPSQEKTESGSDLTAAAANIIKFIVEPIMASGFDGIFINLSNPVDVLTQYIYELSGLPKNQVIGTGTALDTARLKNIVARLVRVDPRSIQAYAMGEHGTSQMVPWSAVTVGGKPIFDVIADNPELQEEVKLDELVQKTIMKGWEDIETKGATYYGAATACTGIIKAIINDENKVIPVSAFLCGEYEETDVFCGVPAVIYRGGIYNVLEIHMSKAELIKFKESAKIVREKLNGVRENREN